MHANKQLNGDRTLH